MLENSTTSYATDSKTNYETTETTFQETLPKINNKIDNIINSNNNQFNQEQIELKQICKLFNNLTNTQRKQFLLRLIETYV
jgi:hypothetical protein